MQIRVISIFPQMFQALDFGVIGRAQKQAILQLSYDNPRHYTSDIHQTVDDRPYGGGPGMIMKAPPLAEAIQQAKHQLGTSAKVIHVSPQGKLFEQNTARCAADSGNPLIFIASRYEGVDERLLQIHVDEQWSLGNYVISGGELAVMVMIDAITRLLPGTLGSEASHQQDSFSLNQILDCPHYTRPAKFANLPVPEVLLRGDHQAIAKWREKQALGRTWLHRPELLQIDKLSDTQRQLLEEFIEESKC